MSKPLRQRVFLACLIGVGGLLIASCDKVPTQPGSPPPPPPPAPTAPVQPALAGTYMLTIRAAVDCHRVDGTGLPESVRRTALPESVRLRQYTATIEQSGSGLRVILSGASLHVVGELDPHPRGDRFVGRIEPGLALFSLSDDPFDYPWDYDDPYFDVMERLDDTRYVAVGGEASVSASLQGKLNGVIGVMSGFNPTNWIAWCSSTRHEFTFSR